MPLLTLFFFLLCLISSSMVGCLLTGLEFKIENVFIILYGLPWWLRGKESTCNPEDAAGNTGLIPGSGRSPGGEFHRSALQDSCLGNAVDRGAWQTTVHGGCKIAGHDRVTKQHYYIITLKGHGSTYNSMLIFPP